MAKGTFWTLVGSVIAQGAGMLGSIFCARILGKVGFGELGMIRSTVLMFGVLAGTGLGMAATKYVAEFRVKNPPKAGRMIGLFMNTAFILGGSVTLIYLILAAPLARLVMNAPHLTSALQVGCLLLLLNTLNGVQLGAVCGFEAFRTQSQVIVLDGVFNLVLIPAGAFFYGVTGATGGSVIAALLGFIVKQWAMNKECTRANIKILHRNVSAEFPELWKFVLPAVLVGVSIQPFEWVSRLFIANGANGYSELGLFTAAYSWSQVLLFLPGQISGPTKSIMANLAGMGQKIKIKRILVQGNFIVFASAIIMGLIVILFSNLIMSAYGKGYKDAARTLSILSISTVFCAISQILINFLYVVNKVWIVVVAALCMGGSLCFVSMLFRNHGANGLAFSYIIGWLVFFLIVTISSINYYRRLPT